MKTVMKQNSRYKNIQITLTKLCVRDSTDVKMLCDAFVLLLQHFNVEKNFLQRWNSNQFIQVKNHMIITDTSVVSGDNWRQLQHT